MEILFRSMLIQHNLCNIHCMVGNTFQIPQKVNEVNSGVNTAFRIGQTLDMPCAQLLFHRINLIL